MEAKIISSNEESFTIQTTVLYKDNMLKAEEHLQECLNEVGSLSSIELLEYFDTDGSPITIGETNLTTKGKLEKEYQTPYGAIVVDRHVYQSSKGGKTYIPLEENSKVIGTATPKFAKMISSKYSCDAAPGVQRDLSDNHGRTVALSFIKNLTDLVGTIALAKEESWSYTLPDFTKPVTSISVGLDGTCLNMMESGWRETMCGTIAFFDSVGNRMHTIYTAAAPEYGKEIFLNKFGTEVSRVINLYPKIPIIGLADGAHSNWTFLKKYCDILTVDFWHASEYLAKAAKAMYPKKKQQNEKYKWLDDVCHNLKHKMGSASRILKQITEFEEHQQMIKSNREELKTVITYFTNQKERMSYYKNVDKNYAIGSGVTEAACKVIVKNRMCKGAARWKDLGASVVLTLRSIHTTKFRWEQFWSKYSQYGYSCYIAH
ncbi:MAG: ISKra4 family transposase [Methylococcales bacterium]|jgi:hypothetical protein|nr:ISKra4 family transposase [Methylococcales bacterium]MBT7409028.1 ISKra4 family transposase [Methylococcales bacterium]